MIWLLVTVLYISPLVGSGTDADPYRVALGSYANGGGVACIPSLPNGQPRFRWGLARVKLSPSADLLHIKFPVVNLDESMNLTVAQWTVLKAALDLKGIGTTGLTRTSTLREVAQRVVDLLGSCPGFLDQGPLP